MKKLVLAFALFGFVLFGAFAVQNVMAASMGVEIVNFDKDPDKDGKKKKAEAKTDTKVVEASGKSGCGEAKSSCCDKSGKAYTASKDKDCSKECPDKK